MSPRARAPLVILANRSGEALASKIYQELRKQKKAASFMQITDDNFKCGEEMVTLPDTVRGKDVFLVQCAIDRTSPRSIQDNVMESLMALEALDSCHATYRTLLMPCLAYARQDKTEGRQGNSSLMLARCVGAQNATDIITMDLHDSHIKEYYMARDVKPDSLYATKDLHDYIRRTYDIADPSWRVVGPDQGSSKRVVFNTKALYDGMIPDEDLESRMIYSTKQRSTDNRRCVERITIHGDLQDKDVLVFDDILDTGGTNETFIYTARKKGARRIVYCVTHPIMSPPAAERLDKLYEMGYLTELITTDTVPLPEEYTHVPADGSPRPHPWFTQLSVAPILADLIRRINQNQETSSLYVKKAEQK